MRRLIYTMVGLLTLTSASVHAADWTTRGGNLDRTQLSASPLGAVDITTHLWSSPAHIGATGAQPLVIGDKIYQLGGQSVWEIDTKTGQMNKLMGLLGRLSDGTWRPSTSSLAYATVDGSPRLYFGTGNNSLCVVNLANTEQRCHRLHLDATESNWIPTSPTEEPIVTAPLVMLADVDGHEIDFVVMGDKQGRVWVFQGFGSFDQPYTWSYRQYDGWILASMVEVADKPLTFVWGSTSGTIGALRVSPGHAGMRPNLTEAWSVPVHTPGQVADGFAKVQSALGERIYALDSVGNLLRIRADTGESDTLHLPNIHFTNTSPAIDETTIYLSIRETTAGTGALIAVDRATFQEKWRTQLQTKANTNPLVLPKANTVLIGDTLGALHAFDTQTGQPKTIFQGKTPLYQLAGLPAPLDPLGQSYQTLTGLSETILAGDPPMLITGISGAHQGQPDGYLFAYRTLPAFDVGWVGPKLDPAKGEAKLQSDKAVTVSYAFYWQPQGAPAPDMLLKQEIKLEANQEQTVTFPPQTGPGRLTAVVNPVALIAAGHPLAPLLQQTSWLSPPDLAESTDATANNLMEGEISGAPDLAVRLQASASYPCLGAKEGTVTFVNAGSAPAKALVSVRLGSRSLLAGTLILAPGPTTKTLVLAGIPCGSADSLAASVGYLDPAAPEQDLSNNDARLTVSVEGAPEAHSDGPTVIMLPEDCEVNPDWTADQPCLNYPGLVVP